ncbi:MAG: porin family protein [Chitinophagaceae bacterium]
MQTSQFWHSQHISWRKISSTAILCLLSVFSVYAQEERMNNPEHDTKPYYFGISIGLNASQYKFTPSKFFIDYDSITNIKPIWKPGFQLGITGNLRISNFIDIRTIPSFILREQAIDYTLFGDSVLKSSFESILLSVPLELKFKSDRQTNFRFYVCVGGKFDYDFNANNRSKRPDEILKVKPIDYGVNLGLGFEIYYPNFILAPEIKISNGLGNSLAGDAHEITTKAIERLTSRMLIFTLHIQG